MFCKCMGRKSNTPGPRLLQRGTLRTAHEDLQNNTINSRLTQRSSRRSTLQKGVSIKKITTLNLREKVLKIREIICAAR